LTIRGKDEQLAEDKRLLFIFLSILDLVKHQAKYGEQNPFPTPISFFLSFLFFYFIYLPSHSLSPTYEVVVLKSERKKKKNPDYHPSDRDNTQG
jgi:hypothetical protein